MAIVALTACSKPHCGESFCLKETPSSFSRQEKVDFDVYDVAYHDQRFGIYEGNNPSTARMEDLGHISPDDVPDGFVEGKLYRDDSGYAVELRTLNRHRPTYVVVGVESKNPNDLYRVLSNLRGKRSKDS
jgi:hypothetical protein